MFFSSSLKIVEAIIKSLFTILIFTQLSFAQFSSNWTKIEAISSPNINAAHFNGDNYYVATDSLFHISSDVGQTWRSLQLINKELL